jgi:hypothetical protein
MTGYRMSLLTIVFVLFVCVSASAQAPAGKELSLKEPVNTKASAVIEPAAKGPAVKEPEVKAPVAKEPQAKPHSAKTTGKVKDYRAVRELKAQGFRTCAGTVDEVLKFFHKKDDFVYLNILDEKKSADKHTASIFTVKQYNDGNSYASLNATPRADGGCDIGFTQVFFFFETCHLIKETGFRDWKLKIEHNEVSVYEDPTSKHVVISLTPTANGCLVVKNGAFFFPPKNKK